MSDLTPTAPAKDGGILGAAQALLPALLSALEGFEVFAIHANALEDEALALRDDALRIQPPLTPEEDLTVQKQILAVREQKRVVEAHWEITTTVNAIHKALTRKRGIATTALDAALNRVSSLHTGFVEQAQVRAAEEEERQRRAAEDAAAAKRAEELAALEAEQMKAEESSPELSEREQAVVAAVVDLGADFQSAARRAGYANVVATAARLKSLPKIQAAILARKQAEDAKLRLESLKATPLDVAPVESVAPVVASGGLRSRSMDVCEIVDPVVFVQAAVSGKHKIPPGCLQPNQSALNDYAKATPAVVRRWPGVRVVKKTSHF